MKRIYIGATFCALMLASCGDEPKKVDAAKPPEAPVVESPGEVHIAPDSPQLAQIKTEPVQLAAVPVGLIRVPGQVEANANRLSRVALPLAGRITSVEVRTGDFVRQGQPLLTLESADADAAVSTMLQAQAAVTQAKSAASKAQLDLERERDLFDHGAVPKKDVLNAEAALVQAQTVVEQAGASLEQSKRRLSILGLPTENFGQHVTVKAPISGKVLDVSVVNGEFRNDLSAPLITIADLSTVWVTSDVPESSIRLVKNGQPMDITLDAYPGEFFRGRVTLISDVVDSQSRTVKVRADMSNPDGRLKPDMFGMIQLAQTNEQRPTVPIAAVISSEGQSYVWRNTEAGTFLKTPVTTGVQVAGRIAVLEGLQPTDKVVVGGVMLLQSN